MAGDPSRSMSTEEVVKGKASGTPPGVFPRVGWSRKEVLDWIGAEAHDHGMTTDHLPMPPTNFEPYEAWVQAATAHLHGAVDTARDELERDRDWIPLEAIHLTAPAGMTRQECIREAVRRFLAHLNELQEGP